MIRGEQREELLSGLRDVGIECGIHYPVPCHLQEAFTNGAIPDLPVSEAAAAEILSLPMWPQITESEIDEVVTQLKAVIDRIREVPAVA